MIEVNFSCKKLKFIFCTKSIDLYLTLSDIIKSETKEREILGGDKG